MVKYLLLALTIPGIAVLLTAAAQEATDSSIGVFLVALVVIIVLVLLNGLFVIAEFSIIGVRSTQLEQMADQGVKYASNVLGTVESRQKQDQYIATAQLGLTIVSLGLAMYGEPQISHFIEPYLAQLWFEPSPQLVETIGYVFALGLLTYLHVVIGEMVPKSLALSDAPKMALLMYRPMQLISWVLSFPVRILNRIGNAMLRLFRIPPAEGHERVLSAEELELIVTESREGGLLNAEEQEMILNIFDFSDRTVSQVMTPRTKVEAIPLDISRQEILKVVSGSRHSRFPVFAEDRDHIAGILHLKDLVKQTLHKESKFDLRLILRSAPAVPEDLPIQTLLAAFKRQRLHMAVVLDEFGGMDGIVTLEDLVEEVVGEVRDEFDQEKEPFVELGPGLYEVEGEYLVDDFDDGFWGNEGALPDVETVGGLVIAKLGRPPVVGDEVVYNEKIQIRVLAVEGRAVARVLVEFPDPDKVVDEDLDTAVPPTK
ncbi:Hemolysins and related proteins containing CBS domains [hydrothermal vent metagenome]|uniref:Hemolysins and related proteins containing CBS domains n=1 Tax=hydrothermal vent metagenome TaxID=652676 RepID=A0A3B0UJH8_9ZZZZ